jgi:hypothetical protein
LALIAYKSIQISPDFYGCPEFLPIFMGVPNFYPVAQMDIVKQPSHPQAEGVSDEVDGPMIWQAIAEYLMKE